MSLGAHPDRVIHAVHRSPKLLCMSRGRVLAVTAALHTAGMPAWAAAALVVRQPTLLAVSPGHVAQVAQLLVELGLGPSHVGHVFWRAPDVLHTNASVLRRKARFLRDELGGGGDDMALYPSFLLASLLHRAGPRVAAARAFGRQAHLHLDRGEGEGLPSDGEHVLPLAQPLPSAGVEVPREGGGGGEPVAAVAQLQARPGDTESCGWEVSEKGRELPW